MKKENKEGKIPRYIVSFSGGKDSTAMLLILLQQNKPIDEIVYFDAENWEFPQMEEHIDKVEKYIGRKITRLKSKKNFDYWFKDHIITKGKYKGTKGYGFPSMTRRWCTREKIQTINRHIKSTDYVYIGYASEEVKRKQKHIKAFPNSIYPLIENDISEKQALAICYEHGFNWGGLYKYFRRVSCWNCPLQRKSELRQLYLHFPELWIELQSMQDASFNSFKMDYTRIEDFTKMFEGEKLQYKLAI